MLIEYGNFNSQVALLAEGVDRNVTLTAIEISNSTSPSSRRAWIEIACKVHLNAIA